MSLQRLHSRRSEAPQERPTQQQQNHAKKQRPINIKRQSTRTRARNTRRKRIWDLLSHIPTFTLRFLRLMAFVVFLLPAFIVFVWHYVMCDRVAAYYGNGTSQSCADDKQDAKEDNEKERLNGTSGPHENGVCHGVMSSIQRQYNKPKDPFFSRHYLDIYGSRTPSSDKNGNTTKKPVVIFITGGAWIIGYRMWGTLLARALAPFGILVIVPDYRNFPRVNIEGMVQDVDMSIQWVFDHAEEYGGDSNKVVLVGQSAGAHIGGLVVAMKVLDLLRKERSNCLAEDEAGEVDNRESNAELPPLKSTYSPQQLCGFISTSSPHNLVTMRPVFHHHGLSADVQKSIFGGLASDDGNEDDYALREGEENVFEKWSPYHLVMKAHAEYASLLKLVGQEYREGLADLKEVFPNLCVVHGTADKTVPVKEALEFISLLTKLNIPTETRMYKGWTHTDPILEAPMRGNHSYHRDIYDLVLLWTGSSSSDTLPTLYVNGEKSNGQKNISHRNVFHSLVRTWRSMNHSSELTKGEQSDGKSINKAKGFDDNHPKLQPICPAVLVEAARFCNPF